MRYESLTTGQTNPLLAAIRNLPDDLPSDNVGLLARLTGGETEGETAPVTTDPAPEPTPDPEPEGETDPEPEPEPAPAPDPVVFEIPAGNYAYMSFRVYLDTGRLLELGLSFDSVRSYTTTELLDGSARRVYDNPRSAIEDALTTLPNVASAEVTFFADKWRIELTPGPGGVTFLGVHGQGVHGQVLLPGLPAHEPIQQGAETDLTPALRDAPPPAPEPTPDPAGQTSPAPGALVFEIGYFHNIFHWMRLIAYPDGHGPPDSISYNDYRADFDLAYLHANGEAVPYGGEVVRGALAVHRHYADPAGRIKAALEALPNVATAKVTLIGLDEPHPVHGYNKAWRIELTEGPGGVEKLEYIAGPYQNNGWPDTGTGSVLTPIEGDARRATWAVDDNLEGGSGDDTMRGGSGDDTLDGAGGGR